jgi:hypothetical protein
MVKPRRLRQKRVRGPQSLLILHLDADKLRGDGLHFGEVAQFAGMLSATTLGARVEIRDATTRACLLEVLAQLVSDGASFDVVVVVAHSNASGIRIASDRFAGWEEFAAYLKPICPRRLMLVACRAGRWDAGEALFCGNRRLRRIFACPVNASKDFGALMLFAVPYVVAERAPRDKHVLWSQIAAITITGRQLREWRRTTDKGNPDSSVFDLLADIADPVARKVPEAVDAVLKSVFGA